MTSRAAASRRRGSATGSTRQEVAAFRRLWWRLTHEERGATTAEYAMTTMAAVGFAGVLVALLRGEEVRSILSDLVRRALTVAG